MTVKLPVGVWLSLAVAVPLALRLGEGVPACVGLALALWDSEGVGEELGLPVSLEDSETLGEDVAEGLWESVRVDDCEGVCVALALRVELGVSLGD